MSEATTPQDPAAMLAGLQALLAQQQGQGASAWGKPATHQPAQAECVGVAVPISLDTPAGKIRVYLNFTGDCAASPDALMGLVKQLADAGLPLDTWQPRESGGGSWGSNDKGWGNRGGGYGSNRSGYGNNNNGGRWNR